MIKNLLSPINNLLSSLKVDKEPFICTFVYLSVVLIIPSHALLFVLTLIYFTSMVFLTGSIQKTIFYAFFPSMLIDVGRVFTFVAVPAEAIFNPIYPNGRIIHFIFSPFFLVSITTIVILYVLIICKKTKTKVVGSSYVLLFLTTLALFFLSAVLTNFFPGISLLYTTAEFSFFAWMLITIIHFRNSSKKDIAKMLITFFFILVLMLILEAGVTYLQFIRHGVLGLTIEKQTTIPTFGFGVDENKSSFRPIGLSYHANSLANWQVVLLSSIILIWLSIKDFLSKKISNFAIVFSVILSVSVIILSISRSAYLSLGVFLSVFLIFNSDIALKAFKFSLKYFDKLKIPVLVIGVFFIYLISNRAYYSLFSLADSGGLSTRGSQTYEAFQLIYKAPLTGVGNGMYIPALYNFIPQGFVKFFPENVHNGFLLFVVERGFLPVATYLVGLYFLFKAVKVKDFSKTLKVAIVAGFLSVYTMMLFQPFVNIFSLNILIVCILLEIKNHA